MPKGTPLSDQINELRRRAAELARQEKRATTDEERLTLKDLAEMYEEMADTVAQLEKLREGMSDRKE